ncbi:hypothetical protein BOX37_15810 [Nocardia mangyaensis]|uniref:Uncharacterized protein n=1 Tax=Nocardia mangyaensis TaxID=2213200 RepID=A0A1J0VSZ6_9NOCA|nr:hypothetical protein [Nocardia mangyaensis]APE35171.1 hypothetical protein BOX37_15810 [Nocardia mangyaensis]
MIGDMSGQTSTNRLLGLFGGVAIIMLLANWSLMRAVAFAVIWSIAAVVLLVRDRRRAAQSPATNSSAIDG